MAKKIDLQGEKLELYTELKKQAKKANQRLLTIYRNYGEDVWSTRLLRNRLKDGKADAITSTGKIRVAKSMSVTQMRAVLSATDKFLASKTSTLSGIKQVKKDVKKGMKAILGDDARQLTDNEVENLYSMLEDKENFLYFANKTSASEMWIYVQNAIDKQVNLTGWYEILRDADFELLDDENKARAKEIYNKYIKNK